MILTEKIIPNLAIFHANVNAKVGDPVILHNKSGVVIDVKQTGEIYVLMEGSLN